MPNFKVIIAKASTPNSTIVHAMRNDCILLSAFQGSLRSVASKLPVCCTCCQAQEAWRLHWQVPSIFRLQPLRISVHRSRASHQPPATLVSLTAAYFESSDACSSTARSKAATRLAYPKLLSRIIVWVRVHNLHPTAISNAIGLIRNRDLSPATSPCLSQIFRCYDTCMLVLFPPRSCTAVGSRTPRLVQRRSKSWQDLSQLAAKSMSISHPRPTIQIQTTSGCALFKHQIPPTQLAVSPRYLANLIPESYLTCPCQSRGSAIEPHMHKKVGRRTCGVPTCQFSA